MYLSYYQFREEPFRLTPDPRFLHLAEPHRNALTTLVQGVLLRKGFVTLTGPVGTGKTTLLHAALQILSDRGVSNSQIVSAFIVNPTLTRDEFLEALLDELEIPCPSTSKPRRLAALHTMLLETQRQGATTVILVDEAHLLSLDVLEEIRLLNNTDTYREKLLQIILAGQPEFNELLARPEVSALRQRIACRCQLRPLSQSETRAYISERMFAAGLRGTSPFPGPAIEAIFRYSQAVPRVINLLCDLALEIGFTQQRQQIGLDIIEEAAQSLELSSVTIAEPVAVSSTAIRRTRPAEVPVPKSAVDILIEAIRQGRESYGSKP